MPGLFLINLNFSHAELESLKKPPLLKYCHVFPTILHEWIHHLQMVGSTYGQYQTMATAVECGCIANAMKLLMADNHWRSKLHRPLSSIHASPETDLEKEYKEYVSRAAITRFSLDAFLGRPQQTILGRTGPGGVELPDDPDQFGPIVGPKDNTFQLSALQVIEGQAHVNELMCLSDLFILNDWPKSHLAEAWKERRITDPYSVTYDYVISNIKVSGPSANRLTSLLADVALNPPSMIYENPDNSRSNIVNYSWQDIHPGWRFYRLLMDLMPRRISWDKLSPQEMLIVVLDSARNMGWPLPGECLPENSVSEWAWHHSEAYKLRHESPIALSLPYDNLDVIDASIPLFLKYPQLIEEKGEEGNYNLQDLLVYQEALGVLPTFWRQLVRGLPLVCPIHMRNLEASGKCLAGCQYLEAVQLHYNLSLSQAVRISKRNRELLDQSGSSGTNRSHPPRLRWVQR